MPIKGTACTTPNFQVRERLISHVCRDAWHWWGASVCVHRSVSVSPALRCHCATCFTSSSGASVLLSACSTAAGQNVGLLHISYSKCSCERCGIYWDCNYFREMYQVFMQKDFFFCPPTLAGISIFPIQAGKQNCTAALTRVLMSCLLL